MRLYATLLLCIITFSINAQIIFVTPEGAGLKDGSDWNNSLDGNTPAGNGYTRLSDLMKWSKSGAQFWIGEGNYKSCNDNDRDKSFAFGQGIRLYSGFAGTESDTIQRDIANHRTIFSGNIGLENDSTDNTKTILKTASVDWNTYSFIDGIDFIGGYNETTNSRGAGILNYGYISLKNCSFFNNFCSNEGGGLYSGNRILIEKCLFANNNAGWGGGMLNRGIADIRSSKFIGNSASYGGGISTIAGANMTLINSLVVNNSGNNGGGISTFSPWGGSTSVIINSTIANNSGSNVVLWWSNLKVYNSIIYGGGGVSDWYYSTTDFKNSIIQDNVGNPTIYDINPKFICPTRGVGLIFNRLDADWGILGDSPAIDKGDESLIPEGVLTDYADNPRIHFNKVDLGAYERQTPRIAGEACLNNQGVNVEYFNNPRLSLEMAPTDSALSIVPISSLGSDDEGVGNNNFRIRGYLLPPEDGYYKFYFAAFNWSKFYLSRDSMEYNSKLAISGCCTAYSPWPQTVVDKNSPNMTYYIDSVLLKKGQKNYFEILGYAFPNTSGKGGIRWTLPGSNVYRPIPSENLQQPSPRKLRSNVDWNIYKNKFSFDPEGLKKNDPVPDQKISVDSLKTNNYAGALNNFTSRIRGYIVPTVSGEYNFYFSSYDSGQFWLSSDSLEVNAQLKSNLNKGQSDWLQNVSSQSLVAEQKYYFEILYHDVSGDDGIKLGWAVKGDSLPEVISSHFLLGELTGIKPTSLKLQDEKLYLQKNNAVSPGYQIYPWNTTDKRLIWKSSDPSVASIDQNGLINPIHGGECRIILLSAADTTLSDTLSICVTKVELEIFKNSFTYDFAQLKDSPQVPDEVIDIESLERTNIITLDYFSSRIRGYLIPPVSGDYSIYFACNDVGQFWLSSDSTIANAQLLNEITTIQNDWSQNISQQTLVAGQKYFFELLHHEQTYTDLLKLGWKIPGSDSPEVIATPYMNGWNGSMPVNKLLFVNHQILSFPKCTLTPQYELKPWNASDKRIEWQSTNSEVASVNADGLITMINPGECKIIATILGNKNVGDTLQVVVTDYYGPYFVKENALPEGKGHSWDDAIGITKLFDFLNLAQQDQRISVFVAKGIYKPTNGFDRTKSFILNNGRMVGGFSPSIIGTDTLSQDFLDNETVLSGELGIPGDLSDNSFHVVATRGNSVLDGLTVRDGKASVSEYGLESGVSYGKRDDNGGGILSESITTCLVNCKISNNYAINGGGGLAGGGNITIKNCSLYNNGTSPITYGGGMFSLQVNGYGGGISIRSGSVSINGSVFHDNGATSGGAIYLQWSSANIENSAFYNNGGSESIKANFGCSVTMNNTTLKGSILGYLNPSMDIKNSTIVGNLLVGDCTAKDAINLDNTIITNYDGETVRNSNYTVLSDSTHKASYCLLGHSFFGVDKTNKISSSIPDYNIWLDTIAYNGGSTPTMKLKNVTGNPAVGSGNPAYLGTTDQRGAMRTGSVSIGAYQLVNATEISISPKQATLCSSGSAPFNVSFLPALAIDSAYSVSSSDESVATISGNTILAHFPGKVNVIIHSADGTLTDTCKVEIRGAIGSGTITGPSKVFPCQKSISYTVTPIDNATSYIWTLPTGATGSSTANTISVDFGDNTGTGEIKVRGENDCGEGEDIVFNFSFYGSEPRIFVTPNGSGTKDGSDWNNSLDGNTPAGNGYTRLSDLMKWSKSGTQFWIAEGTYKTCTDNDREKSFELGQGIKVFGGFQGTENDTIQRDIANHPTIFSGNIGQENDSTDNAKIILKTITGSWTNFSAIDGIDFTQAYNMLNNDPGVGIFNTEMLRLRNCNFAHNYSNGYGAGIQSSGNLYMENCRFYKNRAYSGGGICVKWIDPLLPQPQLKIESSNFSDNTSEISGGGISNEGLATISNSTVTKNATLYYGGGIFNSSNAQLHIYNCILASNSVPTPKVYQGMGDIGGGGAYNQGILKIERSKVCNNSCRYSGGGIFNPTQVKNCLVANNSIGVQDNGYSFTGGGLHVGPGCNGIFNSTITNNLGEGVSSFQVGWNGYLETIPDIFELHNCIVYGNGRQVCGKFNVTNSCIDGGYDNTTGVYTWAKNKCVDGGLDQFNNICEYPSFIFPSAGQGTVYDGLTADWSLPECSVCTNKGDNSWLGTSDTLDITGNVRIFDQTVDIGSYEAQKQQQNIIDYNNEVIYVISSSGHSNSGNSWSNAVAGNSTSCKYKGYSMLHEVLRDAPLNCMVWVSKGVYLPCTDNDRAKSFEIYPGRKLYGGFSGIDAEPDQRDISLNPTILCGDIGMLQDSTDNSYHILKSLYKPGISPDSAIVSGFTFFKGNANGDGENSTGAGILNEDLAHLYIEKSTFFSNYSGSGAAIKNNGTIHLIGSKIYGNKSSGTISNSLSGIFIGDSILLDANQNAIVNEGKISVKNSSFTNNTSSFLGVAGINNRGHATFSDCVWRRNSSSTLTNNDSLFLYRCHFIENSSSSGFFINSGYSEMVSCSLNSNYAGVLIPGYFQGGSPGGIGNSGTLRITHSEFKSNEAAGVDGGAICNSGKLFVDQSIFEKNKNGIYTPTQINGFLSLIVVGAFPGAAICNASGQSFISNSIFVGNQACYGAAVANRSGYVSLLNSKLVGNYSVISGAALLNHGLMDLSNTLITNNNSGAAKNIRGIITCGKGSNTHFKNCTIANNKSDPGNFLITGIDEFADDQYDLAMSRDTVNFENSIIWGNETTITNPNSSLITMNYSNSDVLIPGKGNINSDPLFVNPTAGSDTTYNALEADWTLSACSPAVNAGNDSIATYSLDLAGNARKFNRVDMGAYEMKFDNSIIGLTDVNTRHNATTIQWSRSVNPCNTILFMKDTIVGTPSPVAGTSYSPDSLYSAGALLDGWHCIYKGNRSEVSVTGLTQGTTYRIAAYNYYPENSYGAPVVKNFKTVSPSVSITPHQLSLCPGASQNVEIAILSVSADDSSYTVFSSDESIAGITGKTIYANSPGQVNVIVRSGDGTLTDTCKVEVRAAVGIGTITGLTTICQGQNKVAFTVSDIPNATSYIWTLPTEVSGTSNTKAITVDFGGAAISGNITVVGHSECGDGETSSLAITVNSRPESPVPGVVKQPDCQSATGTVDLTGLPETGEWNLTATPGGATISGSGVLENFTNLSPDSYSFTVTNSYGCTSVPSGEVFINPQPAPNPNKQLNVKVFLEGMFNSVTGLMHTLLQNQVLIPKIQPYNVPPWNYGGAESVTTVPAGVVDWILVELRQAATSSAALPGAILQGWPRAYFLKSNGAIVDLDGSSAPLIGNPSVSEGNNLYVVVRHRNHIAIMSSTGIAVNCDDYSYNFSSAMSKAYGNGAGYRQIVPGLFGMVCGDADSDGTISVNDFTKWATDFGKMNIYLPSDIDADGQISVNDFTRWATNFGMGNIAPLKSTNLEGMEVQSPLRYKSQVPGN